MKYTLGFLIYNNHVLMMNRNKKPWMGSWNGLGGKINPGETPKACLIREIEEETGIHLDPSQVVERGIVTWNDFDAEGQGLFLFVGYLHEPMIEPTPRRVDEGILDWKSMEWIMNKDNTGIAHNIPYFLKHVIYENKRYHYHCVFENRKLARVVIERMD